MANPSETYQQQLSILGDIFVKHNKRKSLFGWLRLLTMGFAFISLWWIWTNGFIIFLPLPFVFIGLFLYTLTKDLNNNDAIENLQRLGHINLTEIDILNHDFTGLPDGSNFKPEVHEYANDLDVFGRASLYQYINRTSSEQGNKLFC
jgi:hypothetical protein